MPSTCRAQALELSEPQAAALAEGAAILAANRKPVPPYRQPSPLATEGDAVPGFYAKWRRAQQEAEQRRGAPDKEAETEVLTEVGCSTDTDTDEMFQVEESGVVSQRKPLPVAQCERALALSLISGCVRP